jgi:D-alanine-D-alanine ligase
MKHPVLLMFGGVSAEHEVSVVTGLQALEHLDTKIFAPHVIYVTKEGTFTYHPNLTNRRGFLSGKRIPVTFGRDAGGGFVRFSGLRRKKVYPYAAYLAFHGGEGESGPIEGLLESCGIPHTGSTVEGSVIAMNKRLTKEALAGADVPTLPDVRFFSDSLRGNADTAAAQVEATLGLPVIVKPVHLGSSIGIAVAKNSVELQKALRAAAYVDTEVLVEPFLEGIVEYNCAVRLVGGTLETSEIERPLSHDAILSFADKYERGGGKKSAGMASLTRELPAKIAPELKGRIVEYATRAYGAARLSGMTRIDFMQAKDGTLYLTEINPIPGSMAYYLWEASGIPYMTQITDALEAAVRGAHARNETRLSYSSHIVEQFVNDQ